MSDHISNNSPVPSTRGVRVLLGDPKKAIIKLALPMILAMGLMSLYNIVDRFWVSGLGEDALSATGYYFSLLILAIAFATGLGVGGGAVVSHAIGERKPDQASSAALHTLLIGVAVAVLFTVPFVVFARPVFTLMGAKSALNDAVAYGEIMFSGTIFLLFSNVATALLRAEGSATKSMIAIAAGALLNIGLDPLFIYVFQLGVAGAAWASLIAMALSSLPLIYWLFIERKSYVRLTLRGFRFRSGIIKRIAAIGIPTMLIQGAMSVQMFLFTIILSSIGQARDVGNRLVGVFFAGWTVVSIAILPLIGLGTAVTSVSAASLGAGAFSKLKVVHWYSIKVGLILECGIALLTALGAPVIALLFTWSEQTRHLAPDITAFLRVIWIFYPATAGGLLSSALFQGVRRALYSLIITIFRTIIFAVPLAYLMGIGLGWGVNGVYAGLITASWLSSIIAVVWAALYIRKLNAQPEPAVADVSDAAARMVSAPETEE
jgi:putative MATE family efflux protein